MNKASIDFIVNLSKLHCMLAKDFDGKLWSIGLNDFIVMYYIYHAPENTLRRIDIANHVGLTASWITRLLLPMEKIGLITKKVNSQDARVSLVTLTPAGKTIFEEASTRMTEVTNIIMPNNNENKIVQATDLMKEIGGKLLWQ